MIIKWYSPLKFAKSVIMYFRAMFHGANSIVSQEVYNDRVAQCYGCEYFVDSQCVKCTCFIKLKAALSFEKCPSNKWHK